MNTLICYVSQTTQPEKKRFQADIKDFGIIEGVQTNVVPTLYAIERLRGKEKEQLERILALTTGASDYDGYKKEVINYCEAKGIILPTFIEIETTIGEGAGEILSKIIDKLEGSEKIILETTGGPRTVATTLTLLSRFLQANDGDVRFSTYAEYDGSTKEGTVGITNAHELYELLEATSVFASTGNAYKLKKVYEKLKFPGRADFFIAMREFYNAIILCNSELVEDKAIKLAEQIEIIRSTKMEGSTAREVVFQHILVKIIEKKMKFIGAQNPMIEIVQWCSDNGYLSQAVTFIKEVLLEISREGEEKIYKIGGVEFSEFEASKAICLRNCINHASGGAIDEKTNIPKNIRSDVLEKVEKMLKEPNEIKQFVDNILEKTRKNL